MQTAVIDQLDRDAKQESNINQARVLWAGWVGDLAGEACAPGPRRGASVAWLQVGEFL